MENQNLVPNKDLVALAAKYHYDIATTLCRHWATNQNRVGIQQCLDAAAPLAAVILAHHLKQQESK